VIRVLDNVPQGNPSWSGENPDPGTSYAPYKIYNIGNNLQPISIINLAKKMIKISRKKLKINLLGEYKTSMFYKYGNPIEDLSIMKTGVNVKTIVEFINITFNKDNKTIYIDNCIRQLKVKPIRPQRIKNLEYSFIDSEEEKEEKDDIVNENKNNKDNKNDKDKDTEVDDASLDSVSNTLKTLDELNILKDKINNEKDSEVDDNEDDENDDSEDDNSEDNSGDNNYTSQSDTSGENFGEIYDNSDDE
jgi:hypothetical protein